MKHFIKGNKVKGTFINRINRFEAIVLINDEEHLVHVPNTGRMLELLHIGVEVILLEAENKNRKTKYTLLYVKKKDSYVCVYSSLANKVFENAAKDKCFDWIDGIIRSEVSFFSSRFDFLGIKDDKEMLIEVKCGTYEEEDILMFPDAPTSRGRRHVEELINAKEQGINSAVVIIAFMDYVTQFTPYYKIDKEFGEILEEASRKGVIVKVYKCMNDIDNIWIFSEVPIKF